MKVVVDLPVDLGGTVWFLLGTDVACARLVGFVQQSGGFKMLQVVGPNSQLMNLPENQAFSSREKLVEFMLTKLLDEEVKLDTNDIMGQA